MHHTISFHCKIWGSHSCPVVNSCQFNTVWHYVIGWLGPNVLKDLSVFIFRITQYKKKDFSWTAWFLKKKWLDTLTRLGATPCAASHPRRLLFFWYHFISVRNYLCLTHSVAHIVPLLQIFSTSEELEVKVQLLASEGCRSYTGLKECANHEQYSWHL